MKAPEAKKAAILLFLEIVNSIALCAGTKADGYRRDDAEATGGCWPGARQRGILCYDVLAHSASVTILGLYSSPLETLLPKFSWSPIQSLKN